MKLILSYAAGSKIYSLALISLNPLLKTTVTRSAPILMADLAQSRAVSPIPKTMTCPFNWYSFYLLFDIFTFSQTFGKKVFELNTLGKR